MTLEVDEDIAGVGLRQPLQTEAPASVVVFGFGNRERKVILVERYPLQPGLLGQTLEALGTNTGDRVRLVVHVRELSQGSNAGGLQCLDLGSANSGDVDERVVTSPLLIADGRELAVLAVTAGLRDGFAVRAGG